MITVIMACLHARSTNEEFQPDGLYFGTVVIDLAVIGAFAKWFL